MSHEKTEIHAELKLDDAASEALHKMHEGLEHVEEKVREVGHELMGMAKQAAATAVGFQLSGFIDSFKEFGEELVHTARAQEATKAELGGMISLVDKGEMSFAELTARASELNERFEIVGVTTGNTAAQMSDAFEMIAARSTSSSEHIGDMVEKFAYASKRMPGGMATLSAAWRDMESGIVRPKNALIQLMKQTGVADGSIKKISESINAMLQGGSEAQKDKVFKLAEEAIDRMAKKTRDMPLTFDQLTTSLSGYREMLFAAAGGDLLKTIKPAFERIQGLMATHREELEHIAHLIGDKMGEWVNKGIEELEDGFKYLQTHSDEIFAALESGAKELKEAFQFILDHRGTIEAMFAGKMLLGAGSSIAGALPGAGKFLGEAVGSGSKALGVGAGAAAGIGAGAATAAVGAWALAADQASKLERESGLSIAKVFTSTWDGLVRSQEQLGNFNAYVRRIGESSADIGTSNEELDHFMKKMEETGEAAVESGDMTADEFEKLRKAAAAQLESHSASAAAFSGFQGAADAVFGQQGIAVGMAHIGQAFKAASDANAKDAEAAARRILSANDTLRVALAGATGSVEEALKKLKGLASGGSDAPETKMPPINFGPTTVHITQDFRNADPDRVAIIFRRDMARSATNRISSRFAQPFGF